METFEQLLLSATLQAKQFAKEYVKNALPFENVYTLQLNMSNDDKSLTQFDLFPEDKGKVIDSVDADEVVKTLLRKGKVPVWIDISVTTVRNSCTVLNLLCAGRYSDDVNEFYYHLHGAGPFGVKSPNLPINYTAGRKFWLPGTKKWFW